jgi:hypothetical protein
VNFSTTKELLGLARPPNSIPQTSTEPKDERRIKKVTKRDKNEK